MDEHEYAALLRKLYGSPEAAEHHNSPEDQQWRRLRALQLGVEYEDFDHGQALELQRSLILEPLLDAMNDDARELITKTPIAWISSRTLNAHAMVAPNGRPVIVMNQGIRSLFSFWIEALNSSELIRKDKGNQAADRFLGEAYCFIMNYTSNNGMETYPKLFLALDPRELAVGVVLTHQVEMFIMAHEMAHVLLGHVVDTPTHVASLGDDPRAEDAAYLELSREQELAADELAYALYLRAWPISARVMGRRKLTTGDTLGPLNYFLLLAVIEKNIENFKPTTHPPATERLLVLLGRFSPLKGSWRRGLRRTYNSAMRLGVIALASPDLRAEGLEFTENRWYVKGE
ncbi:hypothetical protein [Nonomuraea rhodomycinica]|uniref:Uncharacterized protein n=1 Tax=Nonomuraea rhodomycinica TaxID=1712872 RepID=A0A7Y6MBR0_9ACTN|nr:hypothetical protein [Nonomuraea rhodomycinica]NUW41135.1 hypothetical protein [Nonomuraea rhodomycinica]